MVILENEFIPIPSGDYLKGSDEFYPEESPTRFVHVDSFKVSQYPVTVEEFSRFIATTGYITTAEQELTKENFPHLSDFDRAAGSLVFVPTKGPVDLRNWQNWWRWQPGVSWRMPSLSSVNFETLLNHPVTQVSKYDAEAFATWIEARLLTEDEWEYASGSSLKPTRYSWGDELEPQGIKQANYWTGHFPYENHGKHSITGTSPVGSFPPNRYGLFDMIGNVWEWTSSARHEITLSENQCECSPTNLSTETSFKPEESEYITKGGSFLCAEEYCRRYRPAAKSYQTADSATCHLGFRIARDN